ncbi:MAG: L-threonylcarbamoyladenylate synthase [Bacteroidales bacterium]
MILKLYNNNTNPRDLEKVVEILRSGGLVIYPTDTLYAIGCDAMNVRAVERICKIKDIDPEKVNLSVVCYDLSNMSEYAKVDNTTFKLMKRNLPGPFTFIVKTNSNLPRIFRNRKCVGIRVPDNNIARELCLALGNPLLSTSVFVDLNEVEYATDPELLWEKYQNQVDMVIDGGHGGIEPSTIVDCSGDAIEITRQGKGELTE